MTYLLDTHYMIWAITEPKKLSPEVRKLLTDPDNRIIVSAVSFWEISLKSSIGKLDITGFSPSELPDACLSIGFEIEDLKAAESSTFHLLTAPHHRDPFDRMLIWQAISNDYTLISIDKQIRKYAADGLRLFNEGK